VDRQGVNPALIRVCKLNRLPTRKITLAVLLSLYPWRNVVEGGSPFVLIFHAIDSNIVANALNLVVLTAALSVYNSCVYCNSRMLFGLAQQG
ncbi:hypothetical protein ACYJ51_30505, partial [Klebsiella pneumoniae]